MIERLYKMLWSRVGGRPWTYIIRESPKWAATVGAGLAVIGVAVLQLPRPFILIVGAGIGFILGHLFW